MKFVKSFEPKQNLFLAYSSFRKARAFCNIHHQISESISKNKSVGCVDSLIFATISNKGTVGNWLKGFRVQFNRLVALTWLMVKLGALAFGRVRTTDQESNRTKRQAANGFQFSIPITQVRASLQSLFKLWPLCANVHGNSAQFGSEFCVNRTIDIANRKRLCSAKSATVLSRVTEREDKARVYTTLDTVSANAPQPLFDPALNCEVIRHGYYYYSCYYYRKLWTLRFAPSNSRAYRFSRDTTFVRLVTLFTVHLIFCHPSFHVTWNNNDQLRNEMRALFTCWSKFPSIGCKFYWMNKDFCIVRFFL